ncbi:hypothetical protein E2I00_014935 [Balaenoptera physalus]|uniref:Acyltransferase n=1 Tax=Balaenoptera physalus TaxID=9770 RepID=A0A643BLK4_BALPH|nr:hypothetical protein E2I00_014935 [Balaenoptera physalus]
MLLLSKKDLKTTLEVFALFQWARSALAIGGCRFTCVRHWCLWKQYCDYFPLKLLKTHDLSPSLNYILACHPHGFMSHSCFGHFATEKSGFSKIFPGIIPSSLTLGAFFWVPFLRECHVYRVALIPAYAFGETELYNQQIFTPGGFVSRFQKWFQSMVHIYPCAFYGHGFIENSWGLLPYARPVTTIAVGKPLPLPKIEDPSKETVAKYHVVYIDALHKLFGQHKTKFGFSETQELVLT